MYCIYVYFCFSTNTVKSVLSSVVTAQHRIRSWSRPFTHKCHIQSRVKMPTSYPARSSSLDTHDWLVHQIHWFFPKTNYPGVRDLTHRFLTAGGFSDFNHTSMLVPQNNLHCLSVAPTLFRVSIDSASGLFCDPALSVSDRQPSPSL